MKVIALPNLLPLVLVAHCVASAAELQPADDLRSPPFVTARAWAVAEGKSGKLLWGFNEDQGRKAASTTKMMCAWTVIQLARRDPTVLEERVTFSKLADDTPGSTADVKAGESLTVADCLYALMLPSGNDAGNALAEHFNDRLDPPSAEDLERMGGAARVATRAHFIAQMNRHARALGLTNTFYRIPYGDGGAPTDHTTTARDLLRLAWKAMQDPIFARIVGTRRFECEVATPDGGTRTAVWENTNRLLGTEGFDGVKTGTTTQAGNCLVSSGRRGRDHLLVVVLGSESDNGRYVDSQNLFRWAWLQRGHRPASTRGK